MAIIDSCANARTLREKGLARESQHTGQKEQISFAEGPMHEK
jgi:hypothetical protein